METDTNGLLPKSLQKDILQGNSTVHHLSKELKSLFHDWNFFVIMFQLRSHVATLCNGINLVKIYILSILDQVLIISPQKLKHVLPNPLDLKSLLTKFRNPASFAPKVSPTTVEQSKHLVHVQVHETQIIYDVRHLICHVIYPLVDKSLPI